MWYVCLVHPFISFHSLTKKKVHILQKKSKGGKIVQVMVREMKEKWDERYIQDVFQI